MDIFRAVEDLCSLPDKPPKTSERLCAWVQEERQRLGIDRAVGDWKDKPLLYHLKVNADRFLPIMRQMSVEVEAAGGKAMALFPIRRSMVPKHVRFDKGSLTQVLEALRNERLGRKRKRRDDGGFTFASVLDPRAAGVKQGWRIKDGFTTDGVTARLQHVMEKKSKTDRILTGVPKRGIFAIDELKRVSRLEDLQVVGVDPGKRELVVAMDVETPLSNPVRYTQDQRRKDTRVAQYRAEGEREKSNEVREAEKRLTDYNSKTAHTDAFCGYCDECLRTLSLRLAHYGSLQHRQRRWKRHLKTQQSEERLYERLQGMQKEKSRPIVLAYGSWGAIAGRSNSACNKGNPPCIGVGLMKKLSKRFVVAITPEHFTSKTCCRCMAACGPHPTLRKNGKEIRGLRVCQNEECKLIQNRDRTGALNIGIQFQRLFRGQEPLRSMTREERELTLHRRCLECE